MIQRFYNTYAILEKYSINTDDYGQEIKSWNMSTYIHGIKQSQTGDKSIITNTEKIRTNERFYCDYTNINTNDRLLFSTNIYSYQGTITGTSSLSTNASIGYLYNCVGSFSTYSNGDYVRYNSTGWKIENFNYYKILYTNNLIDKHIQIDIKESEKNTI
jgi:hypothetical protein